MLKETVNRLKIVAVAVIALIVVVVVLQNTQNVETRLLFLKVTMPNAALLFGTTCGDSVTRARPGSGKIRGHYHVASSSWRPLSNGFCCPPIWACHKSFCRTVRCRNNRKPQPNCSPPISQ